MCRCCKLVWIFAAVLCLSAAQSPAADRAWTGSAGTDFTSGGSWSPSGALLDTDDYYINIADANAPVLTTAYPGVTVGKLQIGENTYSTSSGKLIIQGGVLTANDEVAIGADANATDASYLQMTGGTFNFNRAVGGDVRVGYQGGKGRLNLTAGATVNINNGGRLFVGDQGGDGQINLDASILNVSSNLLVLGCGAGTHGSVTVNNSSAVNLNGLYLGDGGTGIFTIADLFSSVTSYTGNVEIGRSGGNGTLNLSGGNFTQYANDMIVGNGAGSIGNVTLNNSANMNLVGCRIGDGGQGTLTINASAMVTNTGTSKDIEIGCAGGTGTLTINGGTLTQSGGSIRIGGSNNTPNSSGELVMDGGTVNLSSNTTVIGGYNGNSGTVTMTNGAAYNQTAGSNFYLGYNGTGTAKVTMIGDSTVNFNKTTISSAVAFRIGNQCTASLEIGKYSVLKASDYITLGGGNSGTGNGTIKMTDDARIEISGSRSILVGEFGTGTIDMSGTSSIVSSTGDMEIGKRMNATGELTMNDSSSLSLAGRTLYLGYGGTGTLNVYDSATVSTKLVRLGTSYTDTTVYTGSGILTMGNGLAGQNPTITTETNGTVSLGGDAGSSGALTINSGTFNIGNTNTTNIGLAGGTGTIVINNGGTLSTGTFSSGSTATGKMYVGSGAGSVGTVTVNAGGTFNTPVSALAISAMYFGLDSGTFTWNQNGGYTILPRVNTGYNGANTTYNFNGGVFEVSQMRPISTATVAGAETNFNFDGGTIKAREITGQFIWSRGDTTVPGNIFHINVKSGGMIVDPNGIMGLGGNYGIIITTPLTSVGTSGKLVVRDSSAGNLGNLTLYGNNSAFVGNIDVEEGSLVGRGANAFGFGDAARTIKVNATGKLGFRSSNTSTMYAGDFASTTVPTINVDGGTLFVDPYITFTGTTPETWVRTFFPTRATVNNVTLKNAVMTSSSEDVIGAGTTTYAWNINGTITSVGNSTINHTVSQNLACPNTGLIALQSGDMANPQTTFDVQDGTLTVASPLTDGLSVAGTPRATGLTKTGSGTMTITGNLTYTGNTDIQGGVFQIAAANPITLTTVTGTGTLEVLAGSTLTAASIQVDTLLIGSASAAAVPEPGTIVLLLLAGVVGVGAIVRRK